MFWPFAAILNDRNQIYIIDFESDRIILPDLDFRKIKTVGKKSSNIDQISYIYSAFIKDDKSYVCEKKQMKVNVYSTDLELIRAHDVQSKPCFIKLSDSTICISDDTYIYFFNLNNFSLKSQSDFRNARISEFNSYFFAYNSQNRFFDCFNSNGDIIERVHFDKLSGSQSSNRDGVLVYFKENLLMSFRASKFILKFLHFARIEVNYSYPDLFNRNNFFVIA